MFLLFSTALGKVNLVSHFQLLHFSVSHFSVPQFPSLKFLVPHSHFVSLTEGRILSRRALHCWPGFIGSDRLLGYTE